MEEEFSKVGKGGGGEMGGSDGFKKEGMEPKARLFKRHKEEDISNFFYKKECRE